MQLKANISLFPFLKEAQSYRLRTFRDDLLAALYVALLALPQSIAYSMLAGLPPIAGLYSAVFGTIFTASLGSSKHMISGPTTATAILIQTTVADTLFTYYPNLTGADQATMTIHILNHVIFLMGLIQLLAGCLNLGRVLQFVSRSVILGYFAGVAIAIFVTQLFPFFGIEPLMGDVPVLMRFGYFWVFITKIHWISLAIGLFSLAVLLILRKFFVRLPNALLMLVAAGILSYFLNLLLSRGPEDLNMHIPNLGSIGNWETALPKFSLPFIDIGLFNKVFTASCAIAFLGILEVFSVSRGLAVKGGQNVQTNQELFGVGISNLFLSFITVALPASGSISRSTMNLQSGAKTRFAAVYSGIFVAIAVLALWFLIQHIPLAALAALLIATVFRLVDLEHIRVCIKSTRGDAIVFLLTFFATLVFSLDIAFFIGIIISIAFYLRKAAVPHLVEYAFNAAGRLQVVSSKDKVHRKVRIIGIAGELFFAAVDLFQNTLQAVADDPHVRIIILRLNNVYYVDASMCFALLRLHEYLQGSKRQLIITGITEEVLRVFHRASLVEEIGMDNLFMTDEANPQFSTWKGCLRAKELVKEMEE